MPAVTLVVCGAPLARRAHDLVATLATAAWEVAVVGTPSAAAWVDVAAVTAVSGTPPRFDYRSPSTQKGIGQPDAVAVCPATFNTVNKAAAGMADNLALGVICEAIGSGTPLVIAPMVNNKLWEHFAWGTALASLRRARAMFLDVRTGGSVPTAVPSGSGDAVVDGFDPAWLTSALGSMI